MMWKTAMCVLFIFAFIVFINTLCILNIFRVGVLHVNGARKKAMIYEMAKMKWLLIASYRKHSTQSLIGGGSGRGSHLESQHSSQWRSWLPLLQGVQTKFTAGPVHYQRAVALSESSVRPFFCCFYQRLCLNNRCREFLSKVNDVLNSCATEVFIIRGWGF